MDLIVTVLEVAIRILRIAVAWCVASPVRLGVVLVVVTVLAWIAVEESRKSAAEAKRKEEEQKAREAQAKAKEAAARAKQEAENARKRTEEARVQGIANVKKTYEECVCMIRDAEGEFTRAMHLVDACVERANADYMVNEYGPYWDDIAEALDWLHAMAVAGIKSEDATSAPLLLK